MNRETTDEVWLGRRREHPRKVDRKYDNFVLLDSE